MPATPLKILIADDHPIFRRGLRDLIAAESEFKSIDEASDGEQALQLIETRKPAIAILDIHMPKLGGLDVARAVRQRLLPVKVIILTMYDDEQFFNEAIGLSVHGYVLKDNAVNDVIEAIRAVALGKRYISPSLSGHLMRRSDSVDKLKRAKPGLERLTATELRILKLIAADRTSKEIAEGLRVSIRTVETHRQNISAKLDLHGSHSLLKFAYDNKAEL